MIIHSDGTSHSERSISGPQRLARSVLLRETAACVANSEPAAERFIELGVDPARVFRAPHTTNIAPFHAVARGRPRSAAAPDGRVTILHVGRLIPRKGIDRLVRATATAAAGRRSGCCWSARDRRRSVCAGLPRTSVSGRDVEFRGFVDQPGLPAVYAEADSSPSRRSTTRSASSCSRRRPRGCPSWPRRSAAPRSISSRTAGAGSSRRPRRAGRVGARDRHPGERPRAAAAPRRPRPRDDARPDPARAAAGYEQAVRRRCALPAACGAGGERRPLLGPPRARA